LWLSPYAPLLTIDLINSARQVLQDSKKDLLKPVRHVKKRIYRKDNQTTLKTFFEAELESFIVESNIFTLLRTELLLNNSERKLSILPWPIEHDLLNIETYQDWWVCEKLLTRKRIVFRVIGNNKVGMGHIYRALTLAHEITDHELLFVCDCNDSVVVNKLAGYDYWLGIYNPEEVVQKIIGLQPDLVINDILSTTREDVVPFQKNGIKVVNFEDVGEGASLSDMTVNELYDYPVISGKNIFWGSNYFFIRDEFLGTEPHIFHKDVNTILLAFGGTDQLNLSSKIYHHIKKFCKERDIFINIVVGPGYECFSKLEQDTKGMEGVMLTKSTGVISNIMQKSQIAITSNGRTVYELAHMNIPSIVISQHERENTHTFSDIENGFLPQGVYKEGYTEKAVLDSLIKLIDDIDYRYIFHNRMKHFEFNSNKKNVLKKIFNILESS
jgi:spore coat polysaccharide biosynthesis predicted glycosyltransferase SpsG